MTFHVNPDSTGDNHRTPPVARGVVLPVAFTQRIPFLGRLRVLFSRF
jgi:hypothetical protein